jgi:hypothetical protein
MMATGNLHALLRQGLFLADRPEYWKSLSPMLKAIGSDEGYQAAKNDIGQLSTQLPQTKMVNGEEIAGKSIAQEAGLDLTDFYEKNPAGKEEALPPSIADKIPGLKGMNRGYHTFLNNLRATTFETLYTNAMKEGRDVDAKSIAKVVNTLSGRGPLKSNDLVNTFLFSPKLFSSRLQILQAPLKIAGSYIPRDQVSKILPTKLAESFNNYTNMDPAARQQMTRSLVGVTTGIASLLGLAKASGYDVTFDPRSTDFGKIRKGNTSADLTGGLGPYIRLVARIGSGESIGPQPAMKKSELYNAKYGQSSGLDAVSNFIESHGSPYAQLSMDLLRGNKDAVGNPVKFKTLNPFENRAMELFIPMFAEDVYNVLDKDPDAKEMLAPGFAGATVQTTVPKQKKNPMMRGIR